MEKISYVAAPTKLKKKLFNQLQKPLKKTQRSLGKKIFEVVRKSANPTTLQDSNKLFKSAKILFEFSLLNLAQVLQETRMNSVSEIKRVGVFK